ncbi:MAG: hypothetical protein RMY28_003140 [Nostoc sp. ChiSLP01]|nr:hypothetical protein [Nostoc sp. CmiSLP01]MDZ8283211.1 hypothetical protein [Nostoc sp. ChiSLP01]
MIELNKEDEEYYVFVNGKQISISHASEDYVLAECDLTDLNGVVAHPFSKKLKIEVRSENGFSTYFFYEVLISCEDNKIALNFVCHTPNKYWEGRFGLAIFLHSINKQVKHFDNFEATDLETEEEWKGITIRRLLSFGNSIESGILNASVELKQLLNSAEIALGGIEWKVEYETNEDLYCRELLLLLLRRMGFLFVRYTHGTKEYGKDFTFAEITSFGNYRHYGLQAKAGNISGGVNSQIDELIGQLHDAFSMPFYELGSNEQRYISNFVIAISGIFTENAREKIVEKMPKGLIGSVYFLDKYRINELIERYWNNN